MQSFADISTLLHNFGNLKFSGTDRYCEVLAKLVVAKYYKKIIRFIGGLCLIENRIVPFESVNFFKNMLTDSAVFLCFLDF